MDLPGKGGGFAPGGPKEGFDLIPMWVADMNFATAPSIIEAIQKRISHPAFGYFWTVRRLFRCDYQLAESAEWG